MNLPSFQVFFDRAYQASITLKDNKFRTILSILGITIGIASVIVVSTISKGGNKFIYDELQTFGLKSVWVERLYDHQNPFDREKAGFAITTKDFEAIYNCCDAIADIAAVVSVRGHYIQTKNRYSSARVRGISRNYISINKEKIAKGRWFRVREIKRKSSVAILAANTAVELFGRSNPINKEFRIGKWKFKVIGILKDKNRDFLTSIGSAEGDKVNNRILIPFSTAQRMSGTNKVSYFQAESISLSKSNLAGDQIIRFLKHRHNNDYNYYAQTMHSYLITTDKILGRVTLIGIVAAAVSLFVGGMGITNIMTTSILERTREIGMRKALGATDSDLLWHFLLEALIISTLGGLAGLILGGSISVIVSFVLGSPIIPSVFSVVIAFIVSMVVGILSGYLPAHRAAKLHPATALRYD